MKNEEGIIIFLDQQKTFDRIEWGWLQGCIFESKFCAWINMLLNDSKTCIEINGFVSNYFSVSKSDRQGCPIATIPYVIQAEPMTCTIQADPEIEDIKLPDESSEIESKISMIADNTQFNEQKVSVESIFCN